MPAARPTEAAIARAIRAAKREGCGVEVVNDFVVRIIIPPSLFSQKETRRRLADAELRADVFDRDGEKCVYCGTVEPPFHLDHIHPFSKGGETTFHNLAVACRACNMAKSDMTVEEWKRG